MTFVFFVDTSSQEELHNFSMAFTRGFWESCIAELLTESKNKIFDAEEVKQKGSMRNIGRRLKISQGLRIE
jgi:hypothetical protein